jgi:acyl-homoserine-lactone acylase
MMMLLLCLFTAISAQEEATQDSVVMTAQDSLDALLAEPVLDSVLALHGDSLLVVEAGRSRILRDQYGIPHIYGATDADVAFGFGYAQAQDHLIEMLLSYRMAKGQAAEILGQEWIESDFKSRLWRIDDSAGEQYGAIPEPTRELISGFVDGVNHYIDIKKQTLPAWVRPVRGTDVIAASRWLAFLFSEVSGRPELASKGITPTLDDSFGSNQIVVAPKRSLASGAISASDLHLPWQLPFSMYEAHLKSQEGLNVSGATFYGWPVIVTGHTDRIAWSFTANDADVFDLYEEKLDPANPRRYVFEREKQRISTRRERIRVRTDLGVEEVERELLYSHHGPIYKVIDNWAYAARTTADDVTDVVGQLYQINRATDLRGFRAALARLEIPVFNATYADAEGNIYYVFLSRTPIRAEKFDWRRPVPGWTKDTDWGGVLPFSQLPQVVNPAAGFLLNCNTPPDAVTLGNALERSAFPSYLGWGAMNDRGRRSLTWLASRPVVSMEEMIAFSKDEYLLSAEELKGFILRAYNQNWRELYDPDARVARAISVLRNWDGRASVDSRAVVLFSIWKARFDELHAQLAVPQRQDMKIIERLALEALQGAVAYLNSTFGRVDVRWGEVHQVRRGERSYGVGGAPPGTDAIHQLWSDVQPDGTYMIQGGAAFTSVIALSTPPVAWTALPFGNSEDPTSRHYSDQAELQRGNHLKRTWIEDADVVANVTSVQTVPYVDEALEIERLRAWWSYRRSLNPVVEPEGQDSLKVSDPSDN